MIILYPFIVLFKRVNERSRPGSSVASMWRDQWAFTVFLHCIVVEHAPELVKRGKVERQIAKKKSTAAGARTRDPC